MPQAEQFKKVQRVDGEVFAHKSAPVWVVHYPATDARAEHWNAYRAVAHLPRGRDPWTVDNRRLEKDGYRTLKAALHAAHEFAQTFSQKVAA